MYILGTFISDNTELYITCSADIIGLDPKRINGQKIMRRSVEIVIAITRHKIRLYILIAETLEVMSSQAFKTTFSLFAHLLLEADEILKGRIADVLSGKCGCVKQYEHYETSYNLFQ